MTTTDITLAVCLVALCILTCVGILTAWHLCDRSRRCRHNSMTLNDWGAATFWTCDECGEVIR